MRGSDGSAQNVTPKLANPDEQHRYVGAIIYEDGLAGVLLYPILSISLPAPAVGSNGIEQGESYSVGLTYGAHQSTIDILNPDQTAVATGIQVANPKPTDNSQAAGRRPLLRRFRRRCVDYDRLGGAHIRVRKLGGTKRRIPQRQHGARRSEQRSTGLRAADDR